jgi:hypothetical protein
LWTRCEYQNAKKLDLGGVNNILLVHQVRDKRLAWNVRGLKKENQQWQNGNLPGFIERKALGCQPEINPP